MTAPGVTGTWIAAKGRAALRRERLEVEDNATRRGSILLCNAMDLEKPMIKLPRKTFWRRLFALTALVSLLSQPASAFDTFWHSAATSAATRVFGFSADATNIVQFGNFSGPDFFGPLYDSVLGKRYENWLRQQKTNSAALEKIRQFVAYRDRRDNLVVRKFAIFMHFDNLYGELDSNSKFDYLFTHLLKNTQETIAWAYLNPQLNEGFKKMAILMTLGASLHMVQDFYSHSNWTHNDFARLGVPLVRMPWGKDRAPTWFEVRAKLGDPNQWPFKVMSGVYPPPKQESQFTHTHMNHDNSQLFYEGASQISFHNAGPFPATGATSAAEHQLFAINTAAGASIEWIRLVGNGPGVRTAIEFAKGWDLKRYNPAMLHDLEGGLGAALLMSCAARKWDGDNPSPQRKAECQGMLQYAPFGGAMAVLPGMGGVIPNPFNEFWAVHTRYNLVERLAHSFGTQEGHYNFGSP